MTYTYLIANNVGKVRLQIGDKDIADAVFTDEEIQVYLDLHSDSIPLASADLLEACAATYGANADSERIGDYQYTQKIIANMLALAKRLRDADASVPYLTIGEMDLNAIGDPDD